MKKQIFTLAVGIIMCLSHSYAQVVVFNSNFEDWTGNVPNGWFGPSTTLEADSVMPYTVSVNSGSYACRLKNNSNAFKIVSTQAFGVEQGLTYAVSIRLRGESMFLACKVNIDGTDHALTALNGTVNTTEWTYRTAFFTAQANSNNAEFSFIVRQTKPDKDDLQIDDVLIYVVEPDEFLDINDIKAMFHVSGSLFWNPIN